MVDHKKDHLSAAFVVRVLNPDGSIARESFHESDSFVRNFLLLLKAAFSGSAVNVIDTSNASRSCLGFQCEVSSYGVTNSNIVVGSGSTPVSPADYKLETQITALEHVPLLLYPTVPAQVGSNIECTICRRSFNNHTQGQIDVREIGICVISSTYSILILRDVLGSAVPVLPNQTLQVDYKFRTAI